VAGPRRVTMLRPMRNDRVLAVAALVLGIVLIVIGIVYFVEPASSLPSFFPGHQAGSSHHHAKHGIAAVLLGAACLVFAWFRSGPKKNTAKPVA
jgi:uncharacterized membrane protein HdeD (DUF308 family)